jgi:peptide subunit release factor 1 (eRF1)
MIDIQNVNVFFYTKDGKPTIELRCPNCGSEAKTAKTAHDKDHLVYMAHCPKCRKSLIEYSSPNELSQELSQILAKWRVG